MSRSRRQPRKPEPAPALALPTVDELDIDIERKSFPEFFRRGWHVLEPGTPLDWNWHIEVIALHFQAQIDEWITKQKDPSAPQFMQNVLTNVPPGTAKSRILSVFGPAWVWLRWPSWRVICLSVNPRVALRDSVYCRELLRSRWYRERYGIKWDFSEDQDAKGLFKNTAGGWRMAAGYSAQMVGDRGDGLLVDDANDPEEAHSEVSRHNVNTRWDDVLRNRLNDLRCSTRTVIQQRVHVDDLSGHILRGALHFEHLRIPMEKESDTRGCECKTCKRGETAIGWSDTREPGELLFPLRFPESVLGPFRAKSYLWTSQYQQRPLSAVGNLFKPEWWRYWVHEGDPLPADERLLALTMIIPKREFWDRFFDELVISADCTFKKTSDSDFVAIGLWGRKGPHKFLLELFWARAGFIVTKDEIARMAKHAPKLTAILIEDKANGSAVIETLSKSIAGVLAIDPEGGKEARASATSPQVESGHVLIPLSHPDRQNYIDEHSAFPKGAKDDVVDMQSQLLLWLRDRHAKHDVPDLGTAEERGSIYGEKMA